VKPDRLYIGDYCVYNNEKVRTPRTYMQDGDVMLYAFNDVWVVTVPTAQYIVKKIELPFEELSIEDESCELSRQTAGVDGYILDCLKLKFEWKEK
jgi:hypothetical protein